MQSTAKNQDLLHFFIMRNFGTSLVITNSLSLAESPVPWVAQYRVTLLTQYWCVTSLLMMHALMLLCSSSIWCSNSLHAMHSTCHPLSYMSHISIIQSFWYSSVIPCLWDMKLEAGHSTINNSFDIYMYKCTVGYSIAWERLPIRAHWGFLMWCHRITKFNYANS